MSKLLFIVPCLVGPFLTGCAMFGEKAHCGFRFEILKPPYIDTSMPVLVQSTSPTVSGQPMGITTGPIGGGDHYFQSPPQTIPVPCAPQAPPVRTYAPPLAAPCGEEGPALTQSQWRSVLRGMAPLNAPSTPKPERLAAPKSMKQCEPEE